MKPLIYIIIPLTFCLTACLGGKAPVNQFYLLDYPADYHSKGLDTLTTLHKTCRLNVVEVLAPFSSHQIVLRTDSHQVTFFAQNEWAVRPEQSLTQIAKTFLNEQRVFERTTTGSLILATDYTLQIQVRRLELIGEKKEYNAHLDMTFSLVDNYSDKVILEYNSSRIQPLDERSINLFVSVISQLFVEELDVFSKKILTKTPDEKAKAG